MKYIGIDGCPAGWVVAELNGKSGTISLFPEFHTIWEQHSDAASVLVDIPLGLPGREQPPRAAEPLARTRLGPRRSSLFMTGIREILSCSTYEEAKNMNAQATGKKISVQFWNIVPKIREVDDFLQKTPEAISIIHESHPELCFHLASHGTIIHSKKTQKGQEERLELLQRYCTKSHFLYQTALKQYRRKDIARDDILDALILAVTAQAAGNNLYSLPSPPQHDTTGVPMALWIHDFTQHK